MPDAIECAIPAPAALEVVCPQCGDQALAHFPLAFLDIARNEIEARERDYRARGSDVRINTDHHGRAFLWFYPDLFDAWPEGNQGWPVTLTVCECGHCGYHGKHRFSIASLTEQWGLEADAKVSYCPICGEGPWLEAYSVEEVALSYWICDDCRCEYGYDDTPESREKWLTEARRKLSPPDLEQRMSRMIMNWNKPQRPMWTYRRPAPLDLEDGMYLK